MSAYQPFLLPLAARPQGGLPGSPPTRPLDEESLLKGCDWQELASQARREYGLELLLEMPPRGRTRLPPEGTGLASPRRCLVLETAGCDWFILEHPSALPLFDRLGLPGQRPALARPSLFVEWITGGARDPSAAGGIQAAAQPADADSLTAFHSYLARLAGTGSPSDWHLEPKDGHYASRLRIDGGLTPVERLSRSTGDWLLNSVLSCCGLDGMRPGAAWDGRFSFPVTDTETLPVRASLIPSTHGYALALRFLHPRPAGESHLVALGLSPGQAAGIREAYTCREGLWLVAGPTGAGKSTTLHALLRQSVEENEKVLAVEDPVERVIPGVQHLQVGRPPGLTFAKAVRAFMRQAPDCLLVGEIRDRETAEIALQAARTGHRVLSSIHARDTAGVRRRFTDLDQPADQVARICALLIHQRLLPRLCPRCRAWSAPDPRWRAALEQAAIRVPAAVPESAGCPACGHGRKGRIGLFLLDGFDSAQPTRAGLLEAFLGHLESGRVGLASIHPYLPESIRRHFPLCQG